MSGATLIAGYSTQEDVFKYSTADNEIVIASIGDYGVSTLNEQNVASMVESWNPDAIFTTGDNSYNSCNYNADVDPYYGGYVDRYAFYPSLGNHDYSGDSAGYPQNYFAYFDDTVKDRYYYKVQLGPVMLFLLDSCDETPDGNTTSGYQYTWLNTELSRCRSPWKVVVCHHPPYSSGSTHGSTSSMQWGFSGADMVFSGHEHNYERLYTGGVYYIVNGAGGATLYNFGDALSTSQKRHNALHGAGKLIASPTKLVWRYYSYDKVLVDSIILEK